MADENRILLRTANGLQLVVAERATLLLQGTLKDEAGVAVALANLATLTLTLFTREDGQQFINGVSGTDVKNTGRGTVHATSGLVTITLEPADNQIVNTANDLEYHRAQVKWTYGGGAKAGSMEIDFPVRNLAKVP